MAAAPNSLWLMIYGAVALALLGVGGILTTIAWRSMKPRESDLTYIQRHSESIGRTVVRIERTSNLLRIPLGGVFELSNISRVYRVRTQLQTGETRVVYYAADSLSGQWKVRLGRQWASA